MPDTYFDLGRFEHTRLRVDAGGNVEIEMDDPVPVRFHLGRIHANPPNGFPNAGRLDFLPDQLIHKA